MIRADVEDPRPVSEMLGWARTRRFPWSPTTA